MIHTLWFRCTLLLSGPFFSLEWVMWKYCHCVLRLVISLRRNCSLILNPEPGLWLGSGTPLQWADPEHKHRSNRSLVIAVAHNHACLFPMCVRASTLMQSEVGFSRQALQWGWESKQAVLCSSAHTSLILEMNMSLGCDDYRRTGKHFLSFLEEGKNVPGISCIWLESNSDNPKCRFNATLGKVLI